jgi:hypothetical protein
MRKFHFPVNLKAAADAAHHLVASAGMGVCAQATCRKNPSIF